MSEKHYQEQLLHTRNYLIPYLHNVLGIDLSGMTILEIGCAEGGALKVLREIGADVWGLELEQLRVQIARNINPDLNIIIGDITASDIVHRIGKKFDLIIIRDVIEHIPDKIAAFNNMADLLISGGFLYITFPPRFSPFAGHQQHAVSKIGKMPYIHLLPAAFFSRLCRIVGESEGFIEQVLVNYSIGLSINYFLKIFRNTGFESVVLQNFLIRPIFKTRFGLNPKKFPNIPVLRELFSLGCESILIKK
ncbi:MAG: class I SAM-dependent methyltransferase [Candidatus Neomarinimicrobiota bacterium]